MIRRIKFQIFVLLLSIFTFYCCDSPTDSSDLITINIPINQKSVRAIAYYNTSGTSDSLMHLHVSSFYYDSTFTRKDTTYLYGIYERLDADSLNTFLSGRILLSLTDDWVFFQGGETYDAGMDLIKPLADVTVDTTSLPSELYSYFPIYPRTLNPHGAYSIYRPANEGDCWGYGGIYREFNVGDPVNWNDPYGFSSGIEVFVKHILLGFTINFDLILDHHGIVNSQSEMMVKDSEGNTEIQTLLINRRIVDYSDPNSVNSLAFYVNEVMEKGLTYH